jgi:hypothetical protein
MMNKDNEQEEVGLGSSSLLGLYFSLYFVAILITTILQKSFFFLFLVIIFFPAGFPIGKRTEEWIPLIWGYLFYISFLILMLKFRRKKKLIVSMFVIFIIVLILNIRGCYMMWDGGFSPPA